MPTSAADFLDAAKDCGILTPPAIEEFTARVDACSDAASLAKSLVQYGYLTAFQAKYLYGGKGKSLLIGPYTVLDMLGKGGMGYVYKAEHRKMRRVVALKVIARSHLRSPEAVKRFEREVHAAARLEHPHIVTAFDAGEASGLHYLVMQFVEGRNLSQFVSQEGPRPVAQAVDWVLQAARGMAFAHGHGVVHRDIKPANLFVDMEGTVKILDMGLARLEALEDDRGCLTVSGQIMGTVDYMAPEQAIDLRRADSRSDVYSLGATLWYLLAGRPMFPGDTAMSKLLAHIHTPAPSLSTIRDDVPSALDAIFSRMVAKKPEDRFQSMEELSIELGSPATVRRPVDSTGVIASRDVGAGDDAGVLVTRHVSDKADFSTMSTASVRVGATIEVRPADTIGSRQPSRHAARLKSHAVSLAAVVTLSFVSVGAILSWIAFSTRIALQDDSASRETAAQELQPRASMPSESPDEVTREDDGEAPHPTTPPDITVDRRPIVSVSSPEPLQLPIGDPAAIEVDGLDVVESAVPGEEPGGTFPAPALGDVADSESKPRSVVEEPSREIKHAKEATIVAAEAAVREVAVRKLELDIESLVAEHGEVLETLQQTDLAIQPLRVRGLQLQQSLREAEALITAKASQAAAFDRLSRTSIAGAGDQLRQRGEAVAAAAQLTRDIEAIKFAMQPTLEEFREVEQSLAAASAKRESCIRQLRAMYIQWQAILVPVEMYVSEKRDFLVHAWGQHAEIPDVGIWLAWLHFYNGDAGTAGALLGEVGQLLSMSGMTTPSQLYVDFVYVSLVVEPGQASSKRLVALRKAWPDHPSLRYFDALDAINKEKWSVASRHFVDALRKEELKKENGFNSDAAWFFASVPIDALRNQRLAAECVDRVFKNDVRGTFNAWRAKAAIAAELGNWSDAKKFIANAESLLPKALEEELNLQRAAYEMQQTYHRVVGAGLPTAPPDSSVNE